MTNLIHTLIADEAGFIVSAELVLVATIAVLGMVVGLSEVAFSVNNELNDVSSAFGSLNQGYHVSGACGCGAHVSGSCFQDTTDQCDMSSIQSTNGTGEGNGGY